MVYHKRKKVFLLVLIAVIFTITDGFSKRIIYELIDLQKISRYNEDRVVFQHIEKTPVEYEPDETDNSIASLLVIKDSRMYLFKDGYDNPQEVITKMKILEMENQLIPDLWKNKIDGNPDYMLKTDRRVEVLKKVISFDKAEGEKNLSKNFTDFYNNIKIAFIKKHVDTFRALMINRRESGLQVVRKPLPKRVSYSGTTRYFTSASAKTIDEKLYYAEDADGDGITETFKVSIPDGFHWGFKSGPNIIFIYGCKYKTADNKDKNAEIKNLIGDLAKDAYYGTPEEEKIMKDTFLQEDKINNMIQDIYRLHPDHQKLLDQNKPAATTTK